MTDIESITYCCVNFKNTQPLRLLELNENNMIYCEPR